MKILYVTNSIKFFLSHRKDLALAASQSGYQVAIAGTMDADEEDLPTEFQYFSLPLTRGWSLPWIELRAIYVMVKVYKDYKPDVLHHVTIKPTVYGTMIARWLKAPCVINAVTGMGNLMFSRVKRSLARVLYVLGCRHPNQTFIFQNRSDQAVVTKWLSLSQHQIIFIPGAGVDTEQLSYVSSRQKSPFQVILPARMVWSKGIKEFVNAAKLLKKAGCEVRCILIGGLDFNAVDAISEKQLVQWKNKGWVEWMGYQKDMINIYKNSHAVCLPSYREGISKALLEAMAIGCTVITCDVPGCNETVEDGQSGLLVPKKNSEELSLAIQKLIENPKLYEVLRGNARERVVKYFSLDQVIRKTLEVYEVHANKRNICGQIES
jgi:glycosyltransferase involved in cell wall biosynthesis